ncbi:MAG: isoprenylcysteine carboxylmethyltransferase family protein [Candidatus Lokiarchaeota archaeon]|nr:isoprenylcysteine carboxylmethyltransferase family protein [Candidatus Lokiarchaeota archaeon]
MIDIINFFSYIVCFSLSNIFYTFSLQPMKRIEKSGDKAWKECSIFRMVSGFFTLIIIINTIFWFFFPFPPLDWKVSQYYFLSVIIGIILLIPCVILFIKAIKDAGKESLFPSPDTKMYGGMYNHIRHPQSISEFSFHTILGFFVNSWFMILFSLLWIIFYLPIMLTIEEKDLIKRYGDSYRNYRKETGMIIPKFRRKITN